MWLSLTIILVSAVVMSCVHTVLINRYILSSKTNTLLESAERISALTEALSGNYSQQLENFYILNLDLVAQSSQSHIIITDVKGTVVNFSTKARRFLSNQNISIKEFSDVLSGQNVYKIGPFNDMFGQNMFTVAVPVEIGGKVYGAVFVNSPVPDMYRDKYTLFTMLAVSISASSLAAFILSYIMSKN
ncbi:MAG: hypothetical protein LBH54_03925, partial [Clostridiales bacterium]|nr:hypothetical protein [Clostridiales bacterium]